MKQLLSAAPPLSSEAHYAKTSTLLDSDAPAPVEENNMDFSSTNTKSSWCT